MTRSGNDNNKKTRKFSVVDEKLTAAEHMSIYHADRSTSADRPPERRDSRPWKVGPMAPAVNWCPLKGRIGDHVNRRRTQTVKDFAFMEKTNTRQPRKCTRQNRQKGRLK